MLQKTDLQQVAGATLAVAMINVGTGKLRLARGTRQGQADLQWVARARRSLPVDAYALSGFSTRAVRVGR